MSAVEAVEEALHRIVERDPGIFEHASGEQAIGTFVAGKLHSIKDGSTLGHGVTRGYGCEWPMRSGRNWLPLSR